MFDHAQKYLKRKIKKITYENVALPENYEVTEAEYKKLRDNLPMISSVVKSIATYEHGGEVLKQFSSITNLVASKSNITSLKRDDIYTAASFVGEICENAASSHEIKTEARKFSTAFSRLAEHKATLNIKLRNIKEKISELKKSSKEIDDIRHITANLRYDLEEAIQANQNQIMLKMQDDYNSAAKTTITKMKEFSGKDGVIGVLRTLMTYMREFSVDMASCFDE